MIREMGDVRLVFFQRDGTMAETTIKDISFRATEPCEPEVRPVPNSVRRTPCAICKDWRSAECLTCTFGDGARLRAGAIVALPLTRRQKQLQRQMDRALAHCRRVQAAARKNGQTATAR